MDTQEQCLVALVDGNSLVNKDGLIVFIHDGAVVNTSYDVEDLSFIDSHNWDLYE